MKAVIETGSKQYIVEKGDLIEVELLGDKKEVSFEPLMIIDGANSTIGTPSVSGASVKTKVIDARKSKEKVTVLKFQSKKRVHNKRGHRQKVSLLEVTDIKS